MIVIAGYGFVGKAHHHAFAKLGVGVVDPAYNSNKISSFDNVEGVICCVSTPSNADGSCDYSNIVAVLSEVPVEVPVLIKSTLSLEALDYINLHFSKHHVNFSPEFLRADSALEDMDNLKYVIISSGRALDYWKSVYQRAYRDIEFYSCPIEEAITLKYFENAFLATKLSFFNQLHDFCVSRNFDYNAVRAGLALDPRIADSHTYVDVERGLRGWGGMCFPKDTAALLHMDRWNELSILSQAVDYNNKIRKGRP